MTDDLCGRCLVVLSPAVNIIATWQAAGLDHAEHPQYPTSPKSLLAWAEARIYGDGATISTDAATDTFRPVTTWHGDPVCIPHLFELRQAEMRGGQR